MNWSLPQYLTKNLKKTAAAAAVFLLQQYHTQEENGDQRRHGLKHTDNGQGLVGNGGIHIGSSGRYPEEVVVSMEHHHAPGGTSQHGNDSSHGRAEAQHIDQRGNHGGCCHHGDGGRSYTGPEQEPNQERSQDPDGNTAHAGSQDIPKRRCLQNAGESSLLCAIT